MFESYERLKVVWHHSRYTATGNVQMCMKFVLQAGILHFLKMNIFSNRKSMIPVREMTETNYSSLSVCFQLVYIHKCK